MPELDGFDATRQIVEAVPDTKVLVLTMQESGQMVRRALEAGARGYLLKSALTKSLVKAVKAIAKGKRFLTPKVSEIVLDGFLRTEKEPQQGERAGTRTTPREIEVIRLLAERKMNKEIAAQLGITVRTVETHRAKIMLKLGLHSPGRSYSLCDPSRPAHRKLSLHHPLSPHKTFSRVCRHRCAARTPT